MTPRITRRNLLGTAAAGLAASATPIPLSAEGSNRAVPFRYCLNTGTLREQKLGIVREIEVTAQAGYDAIEPWMNSIHQYAEGGGSLKDLGKRIADLGITVESAIGFAPWIVDDDEARRKGLEQARRDMDALTQIGGKRLAAPPAGAAGAKDKPITDLPAIAARYRALLEVGAAIGVVPQVEVWGFSKTLGRLAETVFVAVESGHPQACILPDVYHLYKGGSSFNSLKLLSGVAVQVFHMNDYPADPPRETINDSHRIYPGDGIAPLKSMLRDMRQAGFQGVLSLELFNREYQKEDSLVVAKTGLEKMRAAVQSSLEKA